MEQLPPSAPTNKEEYDAAVALAAFSPSRRGWGAPGTGGNGGVARVASWLQAHLGSHDCQSSLASGVVQPDVMDGAAYERGAPPPGKIGQQSPVWSAAEGQERPADRGHSRGSRGAGTPPGRCPEAHGRFASRAAAGSYTGSS